MAGSVGRPGTPKRARRLRSAGAPLLAAAAILIAVTVAATRPSLAGQAAAPVTPHDPNARFATADTCIACHNGLVGPTGEDLSIGAAWRATMMANAARDPYWQAAVRREITDHPGARAAIEDKCSTCHMPMARTTAAIRGEPGTVFGHLPIADADSDEDRLAADGVSCAVCHQITDAGFGQPSSFTGGFAIGQAGEDGEPAIFGPFEVDAGRTRIMQSATGYRPTEATHVQASEMCATCHTLYTHALGPDGPDGEELPEQVPYLEWRHSAFREEQSCQSCHMPVVEGETPIAAVLGEPREGFSRHAFRGGNFFMLRMLSRYRHELGVAALPQELEAAAQRTIHHLQTQTATVAVEAARVSAGRLAFEVAVENLAGHKLPTAYPSRRSWLHVTVRDGAGRTVFESGAFTPDGRIAGNDNDADAGRYEPHHEEIADPDDVQIYETIMTDRDGRVTTGLLTGVAYAKDNRLLPRGFDKATAEADVAVRGGALADPDFVGATDRVRYRVDVSDATGPYRIEAVLWFQPIGYRWARNLAAYDTMETQRFVRYFDAMAAGSAIALTRGTAAAF